MFPKLYPLNAQALHTGVLDINRAICHIARGYPNSTNITLTRLEKILYLQLACMAESQKDTYPHG